MNFSEKHQNERLADEQKLNIKTISISIIISSFEVTDIFMTFEISILTIFKRIPPQFKKVKFSKFHKHIKCYVNHVTHNNNRLPGPRISSKECRRQNQIHQRKKTLKSTKNS